MSASKFTARPNGTGAETGGRDHESLAAARRRRSMTCQSTLRWRAIESLRPEDERICSDTLAGALMGPIWSCMSRNRFIKRSLIRQMDREISGVANWIVARTRYIDDFLGAQLEDGIKQLVVLGAGYDTRAYRLRGLGERLKIFELDDIATQRIKVAKAKIALGSSPKNLVYIAIDFNREQLEARLPPRIYDINLKTLFIWEGVSMYLTSEAVDQTLTFISGNSGKGSSVVFDYLFESTVDGTADTMEVQKLRKDTARAGEPLTFGIREETITGFLHSRGFDLVENLSAKSLKEAYFKGKGQKRKMFPLAGIVNARVKHH